jgi:flavin-dependent dehydrogenase
MLDDFHASMPEDLTDFEQVNYLRPLTLPAEIAMYQEGDGRKYGGCDDGTGKFVRAKRDVLRNWLCRYIDVEYSKKAERIEEKDNGVMVHFADGTSASGDVVVGADGVHSMSMFLLVEGWT